MALRKLANNLKLGPRHLLRKLRSDTDRLVFSKLYLDLNKDPESSILVAGSGRSGTTWLSQVINFRKEFRLVFEPFHNQKVEPWKGFSHRQYLREDTADPDIRSVVSRLLCGALRNSWADSYNRKFLVRKRIVKDIRINLMLKYIHTNFPRTPIIFMMRHPCAVALSRMRLGWHEWDTDLGVLLSQDLLVDDHLREFREELGNCTDRFEKEIYLWAVENLVPLRQFSPGDILLVSYEHLLMEPEKEVDRVFGYLDMSYDERIWKSVSRNSRTTWREKPLTDRSERLTEWQRELKDEEKDKAVAILERFGLDAIYTGDPMPRGNEWFERSL